MQSASSRAPKVARKCESKHWYAGGADGRSVGRSVGRSRDYQISGMGRLPYGASRARGAPLSVENVTLEYRNIYQLVTP